MNNTRKELLIAAMLAKISGLNMSPPIGLVVDAGTLDAPEISAQLSAGKLVLEIIVGDDELHEDSPLSKARWTFGYSIIAYLPKVDALTPSAIAAGVHAEMYVLLAKGGVDESARQQGGYAIDTVMKQGGGVGIDPQIGCWQGFSHMDVTYQHDVADPTVG